MSGHCGRTHRTPPPSPSLRACFERAQSAILLIESYGPPLLPPVYNIDRKLLPGWRPYWVWYLAEPPAVFVRSAEERGY